MSGWKLIAMAEDLPENKYDFKPNPEERTFAEQLLHAAGANYFFTNPATGQKPPALEDPKRDQYKTKADVVAFVKKSFADGGAAIKAKGDSGLNDLVVDPDSHQQVRLQDMAYANTICNARRRGSDIGDLLLPTIGQEAS